MSALDLLLLRSWPIEFRTDRSAADTLARLKQAFPPRDLWALSVKPFAGPTNVGTFEGDFVRLRIINVAQRNWLHPELYARVSATAGGCVLVGVVRYDAGLKALYVLMACVLLAVAGSMTWSMSSSLQTTALIAPSAVLAFHALMALFQLNEVAGLRREVTHAIG